MTGHSTTTAADRLASLQLGKIEKAADSAVAFQTDSSKESIHILPDSAQLSPARSHGKDESRDATLHEEGDEYISGLKLWIVLTSVTLTVFLTLLDGSIIGAAIPSITTKFSSLDDVGWYTAAYQLSSAAMQPFSGKIYTYYSTKWSYLFFFALFELGSLICGLASSSNMLIGGRAIAGMGGSGLLAGGVTIIAGAVPLQKRPVYTGIYLGVGQLGIVCGPLLGGVFTEYLSWRWCFYINLPIGAVVAVFLILIKTPELTAKPPLTLRRLRETLGELDLVGFALFAPFATIFLLALQFGGKDYAWNSSVVLGLLCGAAAMMVAFVWWEHRMSDRAMIPFGIVRQRVVWCSAINGATLVIAVLTASQYMPIYFQGVKGYQPTMSGVATLPSILSQILGAIGAGVLTPKLGHYLPFAATGSAISALGNGLVSMWTPDTKIGEWIGYQIVLGSGRGLCMQASMIAVQNVLPSHQIPIGISFLVFCQNFAGAIFVVVADVIFTSSLKREAKILVPSISPEAVIAAGAAPGAIRGLAGPNGEELRGVLTSFSYSIRHVFYMLVACCAMGLLASAGMGWIDTKKAKQPPADLRLGRRPAKDGRGSAGDEV